MSKKLLRKTAIACAVSTVWASSPGLAIADEEVLALEEIVVTARKRAEFIQDVPVAVTALGEQLQRSTVRNLQDTQNYVPNVIIDRTPGNQGAAISIRGISFQEVDKSLDPPNGIILDGVYMGITAGAVLNNFDIDRIEILRGPQGTLFGKNTIGGAINVIRSAPTREWGAKVKITAGDWNKQEYQGVLNMPLTENGGLKLYGSSMEHDGYIENNIIGDDIGGVDFQQVGGTMAFNLTDDLDVSLTVERTNDDSEGGSWANFNTMSDFTCITTLGLGIPGIPESNSPFGSGCADLDENSDEDHSSVNERNWADTTTDYANLTANWLVGDWALTSITGYVDRDEATRLEYDASANEFLYVIAGSEYSQFSQEFRINGNLTENINLTAGVYYWESEYWQTQDSFDMWYFFGFNESMHPDFGPGDISQNLTGEGDNTAYAIFANMDWSITENLILNLGGRYTQEEKTFQSQTGSYDHIRWGVPIIPEGETRNLKDDWKEFSPRVALQYNFNDDLMVFGSYSSGFKSGGFFARTQDINNLNSYDPEYVDTWELGVKSEWLDNRIRFNATAFLADYSDKQEDIIVANESGEVGTIVANASDAEIMGLEMEFTAAVTEGLTIFAHAGLLDSEYSDFDADITGDGIVTDNSGLIIRNTPEKTFGAGADYLRDLSFASLGVHYNYFWRDGYQTIFDNHPLGEVDAAGFHNGSIDLTFKDKYRVSFYGRNLSDERYARVVLIPPVSNFGQYNEPRNYGIEFTLDF
jgi:iron complex outermembrane recepter protein